MISIFREKWGRKTLRRNTLRRDYTLFWYIFIKRSSFFAFRQRFLMVLTCSWVFWAKNDTERLWNYLRKQVLEPKRVVLVLSTIVRPHLKKLKFSGDGLSTTKTDQPYPSRALEIIVFVFYLFPFMYFLFSEFMFRSLVLFMGF